MTNVINKREHGYFRNKNLTEENTFNAFQISLHPTEVHVVANQPVVLDTDCSVGCSCNQVEKSSVDNIVLRSWKR